MRRIRLRVAYDGTAYCGWQVQPEVPTIEGELNQAISRLTKEEIIVIGASRTDAGVHAKGNVAVFDTESTIPADRFAYALNPLLPEDIVVVASDEVVADWHPRHCDTEKTYEYKILNSKFPDPMRRRDTYHVSFDLDLEKNSSLRIHGCFPKLLCIHLTKTFVTLDLVIVVTSDFPQIQK